MTERLTKYGNTSHENGVCCTHFLCEECLKLEGNCSYGCQWEEEVWDKLAHYEDLEEQLEKLYGGKMPLDEVVENLNRIVQNGEEKLDYARILTNAEAEKWDRWLDLEEADRLIELPCVPNETVWCADEYNTRPVLYGSKSSILHDIECFKGIGYTKEAAEANLKELRGEHE